MDFRQLQIFTREIIFRSRLAIPIDKEEFDWFNQGVTPELIQKTLAKTNDWRKYPGQKITPDEIENAVCNEYAITHDDMKVRSRKRDFVEPRQVAMYLLKNHSKLKPGQIADRFDGFNRCTVLHAANTIAMLRSNNKAISEKVRKIERKLL